MKFVVLQLNFEQVTNSQLIISPPRCLTCLGLPSTQQQRGALHLQYTTGAINMSDSGIYCREAKKKPFSFTTAARVVELKKSSDIRSYQFFFLLHYIKNLAWKSWKISEFLSFECPCHICKLNVLFKKRFVPANQKTFFEAHIVQISSLLQYT